MQKIIDIFDYQKPYVRGQSTPILQTLRGGGGLVFKNKKHDEMNFLTFTFHYIPLS